MRWVVVLGCLIGCVRSETVRCGERVCPNGMQCAPDGETCALPSQLEACASAADGAGCSYVGMPDGVCKSQVCIAAGCGNGQVEPGEVCDDGNRISLDGCRADCLSAERCGDGTTEPALGEQCDCGDGTVTVAACTMANANVAGAECRTNCKPARCGDGVIDVDELCDDENTRYGDGCRGDCLGRFQKMQVPTAVNIVGVWTFGPSDAYAITGFSLLHYDGMTWKAVHEFTDIVTTIWASAPDDIYVGGDELHHYNGSAWSDVTTSISGVDVDAVWGSSKNNVYIVRNTQVERYNGSTWVEVAPAGPCSFSSIQALYGTGPTAVYVVDGSKSCKYDGSSWSTEDGFASVAMQQTSTGLYSIVAPAVTTMGAMRARRAGVWSDLPPPGAPWALGGTLTSPELLAVGRDGQILSYDGTIWTSYVSPTEQHLLGIHMTDPTNVFIVGERGTILH